MGLLNVKDVDAQLEKLSGWEKSGNSIAKTFQLKDFPNAILFVGAVAQLAELAFHHPDIDIRWNKVTLTLSTHDQGGLTEKDFSLASDIESVATVKKD